MKLRAAVTCGKINERVMRYARPLEAAGVEVVMVAPPETKSLKEIDAAGLLITGGTDVNPEMYGQPADPRSDEPDQPRDCLEKRLLDEALERDLAVLGICRGLQFLNVVHGGSLFQHHGNQPMHWVRTPDASLPAHEVFVRPGTKLAGIVGAGACAVNSRHHQAADRLAEGLVVSACATDGIVEGLERADKRFVVAVQWHPEDMANNDERQRKLFEAFRDAIR